MQKFSTKKLLNVVLTIPVAFLLASCGDQISLKGKEDSLAQRTLTQGGNDVVYPDDRPSVPDGKVVWEQQNCASCHGATGSGGNGATVNLSDKAWMRNQKPVNQYVFLTYGPDPGTNKKHEALHDKLSRRDIWNLVFYTRSLAVPHTYNIADKEWQAIDSVFGANCAVCHGKKGYGDGPLAHSLEPVPANFQQYNRFYDRTDLTLWQHIANGIRWEGMPNFLGKTYFVNNETGKFDEEYIWKLVQYVRNFQETNVATVAQSPPADESKVPAKDEAPTKNPIR